jgi:hypothetical protein
VLQREQEWRKVADVVGVEVRDRDVRDPTPGDPVPIEAVERAGAAVEKQRLVARLDEVRRGAALVVRQQRPGAEDRDVQGSPGRPYAAVPRACSNA